MFYTVYCSLLREKITYWIKKPSQDMLLVYSINMDSALRIISEICAVPCGLATNDLKVRPRWRCNDAGHQSISHDNSELYCMPLLIKGSKIPQITCFHILWLCFIWLSSNSVQVWIFMVLANGVPDSWECNQTSHEKTGMCLINQPAPEGKACDHVPRSEKKERSILSMYFLSLCNVV